MGIDLESLNTISSNLWIKIPLVLLVALLAAVAANLLVKVLVKLTGKTKSAIDDRIIDAIRRPLALTIVFTGVTIALRMLPLPSSAAFGAGAAIKTILIVIWARAAYRIASLILNWMEGLANYRIVQPRTIPMFDMAAAVLIWGGAFYFVFLAWEIDVTGWLASAGVIGIAVGFAAKDTLANLFSGLFIIADAPYKLGDFIVLGTGERGVVTDIGIRSTRILTRDEVEITVPNAVIANTKIINESGGPYEKMRVQCTVSVAYGSDIDRVKEILLSAARSNRFICSDPEPRVRFRSFGDSGLVFQVMGWIDRPVMRGRAIDALNTDVYKMLSAAGIEIPYAKHDVYIKEMPENKAGTNKPDTSR